MKKNVMDLGLNRTGIDMSPVDSKELQSEADRTPPSSEGSAENLLNMRSPDIREAERLGSVPPPGTAKGLMSATIQKLSGNKIELLINKMGERLAFERAGTRLYDGLINKCMARGPEKAKDALETLMRIRDEEASHFVLLRDSMREMGVDPTSMTPDADVSGVMSQGIHHVIFDPRTNLSQGIHAILVAEMTDNEGWELLISLSREMGFSEMADRFQAALDAEGEHLLTMRKLHEQILRMETGMESEENAGAPSMNEGARV